MRNQTKRTTNTNFMGIMSAFMILIALGSLTLRFGLEPEDRISLSVINENNELLEDWISLSTTKYSDISDEISYSYKLQDFMIDSDKYIYYLYTIDIKIPNEYYCRYKVIIKDNKENKTLYCIGSNN